MSVEGIKRRLDRLIESIASARFESLSSTLDRADAEARQRAERGEPEPFLLDPPPPATARRIDREAWRTIAQADARVVFLLAGRFDELKAAYAMTDADLWQTLTGAAA
jgi:hypothetical protein